jgi:hypothetical protein
MSERQRLTPYDEKRRKIALRYNRDRERRTSTPATQGDASQQSEGWPHAAEELGSEDVPEALKRLHAKLRAAKDVSNDSDQKRWAAALRECQTEAKARIRTGGDLEEWIFHQRLFGNREPLRDMRNDRPGIARGVRASTEVSGWLMANLPQGRLRSIKAWREHYRRRLRATIIPANRGDGAVKRYPSLPLRFGMAIVTELRRLLYGISLDGFRKRLKSLGLFSETSRND